MKILSIFIGLLLCQPIYAGVTITGTRVIFPSNQSTVTVQLSNSENQPALIQAWLDDGDPTVMPEAGEIPFILTPPVVEMSPNKGQMLRLISNGTEKLPQDRESMFWFNILDIPAVSDDVKNQNILNISIRSRIKLFYRPHKLAMTQDQAFDSFKPKYNRQINELIIENPSPYYLNILDMNLNDDKGKFQYKESITIAPYSTEKINMSLSFTPKILSINLINDYGAIEAHQAQVESVE